MYLLKFYRSNFIPQIFIQKVSKIKKFYIFCYRFYYLLIKHKYLKGIQDPYYTDLKLLNFLYL